MARLFVRPGREGWYLDLCVNGRRIRRKAGETRAEAERALAKLVLESGSLPDNPEWDPNLRVSEFAEQYYLPAMTAANAASTVTRKALTIATWIEAVGDCRLTDVRRRMAERFRVLRLREVKPRTVNHDIRVISHMLTKAVEWEMLVGNPLVGVRQLPENRKAPRWLTTEEVNALMDVVPDRLRPIAVVLLNTGLRRGELQRLEWSDVDLAQRLLMVRHKDDGHTKSRKERAVDLNDVALEALRHHRAEMRRRCGRLPRRVFVTEDSTPIGNNLLRDFREAYRAAGIEGANLHSMRHTFGSQAVMAGVDLPTIQKWMGHADVTTTMMYVHVDRRHMRREIQRLSLGSARRQAGVIPLVRERGIQS